MKIQNDYGKIEAICFTAILVRQGESIIYISLSIKMKQERS